MVRTTSPIGPFSCANTCSTAARTFDLPPFARAMRFGIGLPLGFLRWICERRAVVGQVPLVGAGAISRVGPHVAGRIRLRDRARQLRAVVAGRIRHRPGADQAVAAVDADVVLVAEGRHRKVDPGRAVIGRLGLGPLHRPAGIPILLGELGGLVLPVLRDAAGLDLPLLGLGVALLGRGDDRGIDDLPAHGEKACPAQRRLVGRQQHLDGRLALDPRPGERLAEGPDGVGVRHWVGQAQARESA